MELWTEYEGRTIDGAFPLKRLLLPEGRSAFFATLNGAGNPTVIRLIESHFDEEEILARWRGVEALKHPNLLKLEQFGQLKLDETTVIYAVMEPVDANLGEVVGQQRITVAEARDLASSLASALEVLHTHGFVHEHIEPSNIFAVGDFVKMRSDCIREAPEGPQGVEAKRRDVHDLAVVLLQALTQQRTLEAAANELPLPSPFENIVRKAMSGEWGVAEIKAALPTAKRPVIAPSVALTVEATPVAPAKLDVRSRASVASPAPVIERPRRPSGASSTAASAEKQIALPLAAFEPGAKAPEEQLFSKRFSSFEEEPSRPKFARPGLFAAGALAGLLALGVVWHFATKPSTSTSQAAPVAAIAAPAASQGSAAKPAATRASAVGKPSATNHTAPSTTPPATKANQKNAAANHLQWRVVAYTFNHQDQAHKKSESIAKAHPDLRPEVFTTNGRAPFLVTVGGVMSRDDAFAFIKKARNAGMPHDSYAQNYSGK